MRAMRTSVCNSSSPIGATSLPSGLSCVSSVVGTPGIAALTMIASKGASSRHPKEPSPSLTDDIARADAVQNDARAIVQMRDAFDGNDLRGEPRQHRGLVTAAGADFEHALDAAEPRDLARERDHVRLRDGLVGADRKRAVVVGMVAQLGGDEAIARHGAHRREHAGILDAAGLELLGHHFLARLRRIHRHKLGRLYVTARAVD